MAKSFAQDQAKGGLLDVVFIALVEKAITKFIEWLLQKYDIIPKSE